MKEVFTVPFPDLLQLLPYNDDNKSDENQDNASGNHSLLVHPVINIARTSEMRHP